MNADIQQIHQNLGAHPMYSKLDSLENIRVFMKYHVFAVWDFMSLLKSLQQKITCTTIPWKPSIFDGETVRLINEIVLGEESDLDQAGKGCSHFDLYLQAMDEVGADTRLIKDFVRTLDFESLPNELSSVVSFHLDLAMNGSVHEVASSFFYGREKLIPSMFESIVKVVEESGLNCPILIYYLKRHIELDGDEHGPKAAACLDSLIKNQNEEMEAMSAAIQSLDKRNELWNFIGREMNGNRADIYQ